MTLKKGYCFCCNRWFLDNEIKNELRMLLAISCLTARTGVCIAGNKYFADIFNIGENKVSEKIKKLEGKGYIKIEYERQGCQIKKRKIELIYDSQKQESTIPEKGKENNINIIIKENILKEKQPQSNSGFGCRTITENAEQEESIVIQDSIFTQDNNTPLENNNTVNARQGNEYNGKESKSCDISREKAIVNWNRIASNYGLCEIRTITDTRFTKLKSRVKQAGGWQEFWNIVNEAIQESKFLRGEKGWKADFDFCLQPSSFVKLMEKTYK